MSIVNYEKDGRVAIITMNRPEAMNAMSAELQLALHDRLVEFRDDPDVWVGILTGAGKAFCAGADIKEMEPGRQVSLDTLPASPMRGLDIWKPMIAAVNGWALGGGMELVLTCDIRIASQKAVFGLPEVKIGLIPGMGGTGRLPRQVPWCKAAELLLTGKTIDADEAYRMELINAVVPPEQLMAKAREWADLFCQASPLAVRAAKEAMVRGYNMTLDEALKLENSLHVRLALTEDFAEGTAAFKEKRKPVFKGK